MKFGDTVNLPVLFQDSHHDRHEMTVEPSKMDGSTEVLFGGVLLSHSLSVAVPLALVGLTSGFGMGPGVSPPLWPP